MDYLEGLKVHTQKWSSYNLPAEVVNVEPTAHTIQPGRDRSEAWKENLRLSDMRTQAANERERERM